MATELAVLEAVVDASGVAALIEAEMPAGGRPRQLAVRTLLVGLLVALGQGRPAQLTRVHQALVGLDRADKLRLGVIVCRGVTEHLLTYRQVERTFSQMVKTIDPTPVSSFAGTDDRARAMRLDGSQTGIESDGWGARLVAFCDLVTEASIPDAYKHASSSVAVDWTDQATWARPRAVGGIPADPDARWGHRNTNVPGARSGLFFGYYAQAVTTVADEGGAPVPELVRRVVLHPCDVDPPGALVATLQAMANDGIELSDVLADSGYAHRVAERWATPLRRMGADLVTDLHPNDRGPRGTHRGAIASNGALYCPATPAALLGLGPLAHGASPDEIAHHDAMAAELSRYKLGRITSDDEDGYHRVSCPASAGKLRCPKKDASMTLPFDRPEVLAAPSHTPVCCAQATITVPPSVNAKTRQKHDYPSRAHRLSYGRRTAVERSFATLKDPSSTDIRRGWCRLMGRTKNLVMLVLAVVVRNLRVVASFERRCEDEAHRTGPRRRKRRRVLAD